MKLSTRSILLMVFVFVLSGCAGTPKTEQEQYAEMRDTFGYKTFETLSEKTVNPSVSLYNSRIKKDHQPQIRPEIIHSYSAVLFALSMQPKWAIAEANLALNSADDDAGRYVAYSALSIALHSNGWKGLGEEYAARASVLEGGELLDEKYQDSRITAKVVVGVSAIYQGDGESAEKLFSELGEKTGHNWLPIAAHGAAIIMDGPGFSTVSKLKALAARDSISFSEKQKLLELQAISETHQDDPERIKADTGDLVKKWSMDALALLGESAVDATLDAVRSLVMLMSHS